MQNNVIDKFDLVNACKPFFDDLFDKIDQEARKAWLEYLDDSLNKEKKLNHIKLDAKWELALKLRRFHHEYIFENNSQKAYMAAEVNHA